MKQARSIPPLSPDLTTEFAQAESDRGGDEAGPIARTEAALYDPPCPWRATAHFGAQVRSSSQYLRLRPRQYRNLCAVRAEG